MMFNLTVSTASLAVLTRTGKENRDPTLTGFSGTPLVSPMSASPGPGVRLQIMLTVAGDTDEVDAAALTVTTTA